MSLESAKSFISAVKSIVTDSASQSRRNTEFMSAAKDAFNFDNPTANFFPGNTIPVSELEFIKAKRIAESSRSAKFYDFLNSTVRPYLEQTQVLDPDEAYKLYEEYKAKEATNL